MKKKLLIALVIILFNFHSSIISACTGITSSNEMITLMGNNEDYIDPDTYIWFKPPESEKFCCSFVGYKGFWAQGGINEKGLCFDGFGTPFNPYYTNTENKPIYRNGNLAEKALEECQNISELVNLFDQYYFPALKISQLFFVDKEGNSVIIGRDVNTFKEYNFQVCTNFFQTHPELGGYPCWRYSTAFQMLEQSDEISIGFFKNILDAVHIEQFSPTQYSNIYDLNNGLIYLYYYHDFNDVIVLNLTGELELGYHYYSIPSLFLDNSESPSKPSQPAGINEGKSGNEYYYSTSSTDPNGDNLFYLFDWDDLSIEEWIGSFESGEVINFSHIWDSKGEYNIRVKAKDIEGYESEWSDSLVVSMPKNRLINEFNPWIFRLIQRFPILEYLI
jgi:hypothetical protein